MGRRSDNKKNDTKSAQPHHQIAGQGKGGKKPGRAELAETSGLLAGIPHSGGGTVQGLQGAGRRPSLLRHGAHTFPQSV